MPAVVIPSFGWGGFETAAEGFDWPHWTLAGDSQRWRRTSRCLRRDVVSVADHVFGELVRLRGSVEVSYSSWRGELTEISSGQRAFANRPGLG
jgi:hypothetical protein